MTATTFVPPAATWAQRGTTSVLFLALGVSGGAWAAALPGIKAGLSLSDRELSIALLGVALASVLSTIAAGTLAPRIGTGRASAGAALALAVSTALPAFAQSLPQLVGCCALFGLTIGFLDVAMNGHASEVEQRWGRAIMSSFHGAFSLGGLIGAVLGGLLATAGFGSVGQLGLPAIIVGCLASASAPGLGPGSRSGAHEGGLAWPERAAWSLCAVAFVCLIVEGAVADWSAVYLATVANVAQGAAATGFAAFSVAMTLGRLTGDQIVRWLGARIVVAGGGVLAAFGLALSVAFPSFLPATFGFALVGLGLANMAPTVFSAAGRFGRTPAAGLGMVVSFGYVGFISGPPLIGTVATAFDLRTALGVLVAVAAVLAPLGWWMRTAPDR